MGLEGVTADGTDSFRSSIRLLGVKVKLAAGGVSPKLGLGMPSCW